MPIWEFSKSTPKYMGMTVVVVSNENFQYELYLEDIIDLALKRYEKNLYPASSIRLDLPKYEVSRFSNANALPMDSIVEFNSLEISQSVILAYKRFLKNKQEANF
ncbi:hypothetical protein DLK06_15680 [Acinetobacter pittii]|nr:hypothetical protein DLK06_15680 [Acinetobacter pittii]